MSTHEIFPAELIVQSIRDNGYKSTDFALAELIDNSLQANAGLVDVLLVEEDVQLERNVVRRVTQIAVADDGRGMDAATLRMALQFGNGLNRNDPHGIGRFGMGLPMASFSQARRVEVYSWESGGPEAAIWCSLSLDAIADGSLREVPEPEPRRVPDAWQRRLDAGESGTLVIWSDVDRATWKTATSVISNTARLVGRLYRYFLPAGGGRSAIRLVPVVGGHRVEGHVHSVMVNDPLFLMAPSATSPPFGKRPMFELYGQPREFEFHLPGGGTSVATVVCSRASDEALKPRDGSPAGGLPYGKDAAKNRGVSIVRSNRELDLDDAWNRGDTFRDRFWGIEIRFAPALDELFGVTNNKQAATKLSQLAGAVLDPDSEDDWKGDLEDLEAEGDPRAQMMRLVQYVKKQIDLMRADLRRATEGTRKAQRQRHEETEEDAATRKLRELAREQGALEVENEDGVVAHPDAEVADDDLRESVVDVLEGSGISEDDAREIADQFVERNRNIVFTEAPSDSDAFFLPRAHDGYYQVQFNSSHPFTERLREVMSGAEEAEEGDNALSAEERVQRAARVIHLLLVSFAREELEARARRSEHLAQTRKDWGRSARFFLQQGDTFPGEPR